MKHKKKIVVGLVALGLALAALIGWSAHNDLKPAEPQPLAMDGR